MQATYAVISKENIITLETESLDPATLPPDHLLHIDPQHYWGVVVDWW